MAINKKAMSLYGESTGSVYYNDKLQNLRINCMFKTNQGTIMVLVTGGLHTHKPETEEARG